MNFFLKLIPSYILIEDEKERILAGGRRFEVKRANIIGFKEMARNRPSNIRLLLANDDIASWSVLHIGFSDQGVLEIVSYEDNRESIQAALGRFQGVIQLDRDSRQNSLSPLEITKLSNRMNKVK